MISLIPFHSDSKEKESISCSLFFKDDLEISYHIRGFQNLVIPRSPSTKRVLGLWNSTCFEAFFLMNDQSYYEMNMAPNGEWNLFFFSSYREGMKESLSDGPSLNINEESHFSYKWNKNNLPFNSTDIKSVGLSAVMIKDDRPPQFWALAHPQKAPDFHKEQTFENFDSLNQRV